MGYGIPGPVVGAAGNVPASAVQRRGLRHTAALVWAIAALAATSIALAQAGPEAGEVLVGSGANSLSRPGMFATPIRPGTRLLSGDRLRTGGDGHVQFRLRDGSSFALGPDTEFTIADFRFEPGRQRAFFEMARGLVRTVSGLIGKKDRDAWRLTTPTAVMGIRGTEFTVEEGVCNPGPCKRGERGGLRVAVHEGRVAVSNAGGSVEVPRGATFFVGGRAEPGQFVSSPPAGGAQLRAAAPRQAGTGEVRPAAVRPRGDPTGSTGRTAGAPTRRQPEAPAVHDSAPPQDANTAAAAQESPRRRVRVMDFKPG